jgi:hypothetical protein
MMTLIAKNIFKDFSQDFGKSSMKYITIIQQQKNFIGPPLVGFTLFFFVIMFLCC